MIKATIRANGKPAANDPSPRSRRPAVVDLVAMRAGAASSAGEDEARALLARVAAGDESAFEALYRSLSRRVYAFALRLTGHGPTAEEVTTDTMHEMWRAAGRFRRDARVSTWVLGIARNKALLTLRARPPLEHVEIGEVADSLDSGMPDGFARLAEARDRETVRRGLDALSSEHRECLHLAYFEDMSVLEIAALLGIPEGTVKSRLWHAKGQLASRIIALRRQPRPR